MRIKANPKYDSFMAELRLARGRLSKWRGVAFRAAPLEFARLAKLLDGRGGLQRGGRWLAPGVGCVVNLSTTQETAIGESSANFTYYNFASRDVKPKVIVAVRLKLNKVFDLTDPRNFSSSPWLPLKEFLAEDWRKTNDHGLESQSQVFGRAARDTGAEALLVPSARVSGGINLVYFPEVLVRASRTEILGEEELARWLKSR